MNAIVSVTADWGIGMRGSLLVRNPADMRFFKNTTMGGTIICGRTTFESFPGGPLKGRRNIVLSRDESFKPEGAHVVHSTKELHEAICGEDPNRVWLIGGASIYEALLPYCERAYVTMNDIRLPADAWFPNLSKSEHWTLERVRPGGVTQSDVPYEFRTYLRI